MLIDAHVNIGRIEELNVFSEFHTSLHITVISRRYSKSDMGGLLYKGTVSIK